MDSNRYFKGKRIHIWRGDVDPYPQRDIRYSAPYTSAEWTRTHKYSWELEIVCFDLGTWSLWAIQPRAIGHTDFSLLAMPFVIDRVLHISRCRNDP